MRAASAALPAPERLASPPATWAVDGHVHLHPGVVPGTLLAHASRNLRSAVLRGGPPPQALALLIAERPGSGDFDRLRAAAAAGADGWQLVATGEAASFLALRGEEPPVVVVAGHQLATGTGLEVLHLGARRPAPAAPSLAATVAAVLDRGGLPVVPWGFGKWTGRRRREVAALAEGSPPGPWLFGDSGLRPRPAAAPAPLRHARAAGLPIVAGSDPLALPGDAARAGTYGFVCELPWDAERPAEALIRHLATGRPTRSIGRRQSLPRALLTQAALRTAGARRVS